MRAASPFNLSSRTAIITGASKGIGKSIAQALGEQGANVVISSRNQESLNQVKAEFAGQGIRCEAIAAKIGDKDSMHDLVAATRDAFGPIHILVNNAAANPSFGPLNKTDDGVFDKIMEVNVKGPLAMAKMCYQDMKEAAWGSVINISSVGGISPEDLLGLYSVSKAALISLTKVMAKEWGSKGIRANVICPGLIKTKFSEALWKSDPIMQKFLAKQPLPRIGEPDDISGMALLLASDAGAYCTGGVYTVDGGYTI